MRFSAAALVLASVGFAAAQTTTTLVAPKATSGTCSGENILQACLGTETAKVENCGQQDYVCLCTNKKLVARCYDSAGCSGDQRRAGVDAEVVAYCNAAAPLMTTSTISAATSGSSGSVSSSVTGTSSPTSPGSSSSISSSTTSATGSTQSPGAAGSLVAPFGSVVAFALGVAGLL